MTSQRTRHLNSATPVRATLGTLLVLGVPVVVIALTVLDGDYSAGSIAIAVAVPALWLFISTPLVLFFHSFTPPFLRARVWETRDGLIIRPLLGGFVKLPMMLVCAGFVALMIATVWDFYPSKMAEGETFNAIAGSLVALVICVVPGIYAVVLFGSMGPYEVRMDRDHLRVRQGWRKKTGVRREDLEGISAFEKQIPRLPAWSWALRIHVRGDEKFVQPDLDWAFLTGLDTNAVAREIALWAKSPR